ncbi:MAG: LLM class flavin-dependent oxidoreductase [Anaerolineae bacterium]
MKIGLVINIGEDQRIGRTLAYGEIRDMARLAESAGFDSIWLFDHLLFRDDDGTAGIWECWTTLAALAEATERVDLGTLVMCAQFRNPALLAKMAVTLDEVSRGRLILGLGAGWHQPEFDAFGFPYDHRVDRFQEALQIIRPLLREGRVDFQGRYHDARDCEIIPRGPRPQGPPLLVGAFGPRMLRLAARYGDLWNHAWLGTADGLAKPRARLEEACAQEGRDPKSLAVTAGVSVIYPDLGAVNGFARNPLSGSAEEVATALRGYANLEVSHLIVQLTPFTSRAVERLAAAVRRFRSTAGDA